MLADTLDDTLLVIGGACRGHPRLSCTQVRKHAWPHEAGHEG
jgi:hypothetical protein